MGTNGREKTNRIELIKSIWRPIIEMQEKIKKNCGSLKIKENETEAFSEMTYWVSKWKFKVGNDSIRIIEGQVI